MALSAVALLLAVSQLPQGPDTSRDFVMTEKTAILMAPPDVVCGPTVQSMKWSSDGKMLAVVRVAMDIDAKLISQLVTERKGEPPPAELELLIWSSASRTTRRIYSMNPKEGVIANYGWLPGSSSLFAHVKSYADKKDDQVLLMTPNSNPTVAFTIPSTNFVECEISPSKPIAGFAIFKDGSVQTEGQLRFLTPSGAAQELVLPKMTAFLTWGGDGSKAYVRSVYKGTGGGNTLSEGWYTVNREGGRYEKAPGAPGPVEIPGKRDLATLPLSVEVLKSENGSAKAQVVTLLSKNAPNLKMASVGVISSDGYDAVMAPDESAVAYVSQGLGLVRRLIPISKDAFLAARNAAAKVEILSKSKQIGLALVMFSADMDDSFPENSGWSDKVTPYIGNKSMLDGFNYTFAGGAVTDPSKTMLGFMSGPGGRAVVYADGHVVWVAD